MPNNDYIKRSDALKAIRDVPPGNWSADRYKFAIWEVPAADVEPVRHGRWIHVPGKQTRICSRCETDEPYKFADEDTDIYSWCPHCGAKMDEEDKNA